MNSVRAALGAAVVMALAGVASRAVAQFPTKPPAPAPLKPAHFPPFQRATLPNGVRLVVIESHRQPVISATLSFAGGGAYDPENKEGVADLVAALLTKGAGSRTAEQIADAIEGVGGSIGAGAGSDFLTVRVDALASSAPLALELLADAAARPSFPDKEIELARTQLLSTLQLQQSQPATLAQEALYRELYGSHPYARYSKPATVRSITRADLLAFQAARLKPTGALLVVAGDMTLAQAKSLATKAFGTWSGAPAPPPKFAAPPARSKREIVLVNRPGSVQSDVVVGNLTFLPNDPRYYAVVLGNRVLGAGTDSRLFMTLREKKSWTYDAHSSIARPRGVGLVTAQTEVRTSVTDSALAELLHIVEGIGSAPIPASEMANAKSAIAGNFPLTIETAEQVAGAVTSAMLLGLPADYLSTYRTKIAALTPAQVQAAMRATVRPEQSVIVVVGDGPQLYERLAKIAPTRVVDADGAPVKPADLMAGPAALDLDLAQLVTGTDSFAVMVQGKPLGYERSTTEKTATGWKYTDDTQIATFVQQHSEVTLDAHGAPEKVVQSGTVQGQAIKIDATYANNHVKGSGSTVTQQGLKSATYDTALAAGTVDALAVQALAPAIKWQPGAKVVVNAFRSDAGKVEQYTMTVGAAESVTVPAGTFQAYRVEQTGGEQPMTIWVTSAAPHKIVKTAFVGVPIEVVRVK